MIIEIIKNIKSDKKDLRNFGLVVGLAFGILGGVLFWKEKESYIYFVILSTVLIGGGFVFPNVLKPLHKAWMLLAIIMGGIMTRVVCCLLFYLMVTPIGIVARLFGKDLLDMRIDKESESYWNPKDRDQVDKSVYERQF
ncbi:MAG: hypothetical protein K9M57_01225 [Phycisphaerae bacterium]|nr:hypothetical protein [Phycisphaerae bacterium]